MSHDYETQAIIDSFWATAAAVREDFRMLRQEMMMAFEIPNSMLTAKYQDNRLTGEGGRTIDEIFAIQCGEDVDGDGPTPEEILAEQKRIRMEMYAEQNEKNEKNPQCDVDTGVGIVYTHKDVIL